MGLFYIISEDSNEMFEMAVTESVSVTGDTRVSSSKTEDRTVVSDNAVAYNQIISYNGTITSIDSIGTNPRALTKPEEYLESLELIRKDRGFVTCFIDSNLNPITNCLIEKFNFDKTLDEGLTSWKVSISCKQVRVTTEASSTTVPRPDTRDPTADTQNAGNATTKQENDSALNTGGFLDFLPEASTGG